MLPILDRLRGTAVRGLLPVVFVYLIFPALAWPMTITDGTDSGTGEVGSAKLDPATWKLKCSQVPPTVLQLPYATGTINGCSTVSIATSDISTSTPTAYKIPMAGASYLSWGWLNLGAVAGSAIPDANLSRDLGSTSYRWSSIYGSYLSLSTNAWIGGTLYLGGSVLSSLVPSQTLTYNLGSSSYRWNAIYGGLLDLSGNLNVGGRVLGSLVPNQNLTEGFNLGSSSYRWNELWVGLINASQSISSASTISGTNLTAAGHASADVALSYSYNVRGLASNQSLSCSNSSTTTWVTCGGAYAAYSASAGVAKIIANATVTNDQGGACAFRIYNDTTSTQVSMSYNSVAQPTGYQTQHENITSIALTNISGGTSHLFYLQLVSLGGTCAVPANGGAIIVETYGSL